MEKSEILHTIPKAAAVTAFAVLIMVYPSAAAESTVNSINVCINAIIPSMFAFMALSSYVQSSGLYRVIFRPVLFILRHIINADDEILSVFLLSLFGGYPVGVKLLGDIISQNKNSPAIKEVCGKAAMFCYCVSPPFALIMLGNGVFGSTEAGMLIYISNVLACFICAAAVSGLRGLKCGGTVKNAGTGLAEAVGSAAHSLLTVCTVIVLFNTALTCVKCLFAGAGITLPDILLGALEISNLLKISSPSVSLIPITAAISSFGGICVMMQCGAIVKGRFPIGRFIIARLPCALMSGVICRILLLFTDISVSASTFSGQHIYKFSANIMIVPILMAMCIIFFNKSDKISEKL